MVERLNISGCDAAMGCRSEVGAKERRKNLMAVEARVQKQWEMRLCNPVLKKEECDASNPGFLAVVISIAAPIPDL
jgi:hypothetical protein